MGIYLNPGNKALVEAVDSAIYVDKTAMIAYLNTLVNTKRKYVSVSRPRRFGKTMAADMISAYYENGNESRDIFEGLMLSKTEPQTIKRKTILWDEYLGAFDVIRIVMTDFIKADQSVEQGLNRMQRLVLRDIRMLYPQIDYYDEDNLVQSLFDTYACTKRAFVIVIDEWDAVFRIRKEDTAGQKKYLDFLRDLFKDRDYIALAYMTGILPIKKYGQHSALNMFTEYSMIQPMRLAEYTGFTEEEVRNLCEEYNMSYDEVSDWYDGYLVNDFIPVEYRDKYRKGEYFDNQISIYSPLSVVSSVTDGDIGNYWNESETYEALAEYIRMDYDGLKASVALLMDGGRLSVDLNTYQNDMTTFTCKDDVMALLIHLGYLGYDKMTGEVFIPNKEVKTVFEASTKSSEWDMACAELCNQISLL